MATKLTNRQLRNHFKNFNDKQLEKIEVFVISYEELKNSTIPKENYLFGGTVYGIRIKQ